MTDSSAVITITGIGGSKAVTVGTGETLADALVGAGFEVESAGLQVRVNGEAVTDPSSVSPENGAQVTVTPRDTKLG